MGTLILEAKIQVVDNGTTHTKELDTKKREKTRRKYPDYPEKLGFCTVLRKIFFFEERVTNQFDESALAFNIYEQITNSNYVIEILVQQSNFYFQQN